MRVSVYLALSSRVACSFKLDGQVKYWTDYLKVQLHHKSLFQLPGQHEPHLPLRWTHSHLPAGGGLHCRHPSRFERV